MKLGDSMKILLYTEGLKTISKSGLGKAIKHQMRALEDNHIEYTTSLKDDYDILHVNFYGPKSYWYTKKARKKGKKIVYHAHSTEEDFRNSFLFSNLVAPLFKKWLVKCYRLGDYIITPTEYSKRLLENYSLNRPIRAISNGVDTKFFERNEKAGFEFRKTYGYQKEDKIIVGIGLYIKRKGILDFVELATRLPQYKFIWFGYSPLWASPREIKKAVHTKLPNLYFAGYVESSMIRSALSGADLYLFPTLEETEGIPIIEALTSKIPTLIRDIPVFEEYPANKVVYKAKDIDEFEEKIQQILEHKLPDLTEEGYRMAKKKDVGAVGKELIETYQEVLQMERVEEPKKKHSRFLFSMLVLFVVFLIFLIAAWLKPKPPRKYSRSFEAMGTSISAQIYAKNEEKGEEVLDNIEKIYQEYDKLTNRQGEVLSYISHNEENQGVLTIDNRLYDLLVYGMNWYEKSNGSFHLNMGDAYDLWEYYRQFKTGIPSSEEIQALTTEENQIFLLGDNRIQNTHPSLDLDAIKVGYATKKVEDYLKEEEIDTYLINAGTVISVGNYPEKEGKYLLGVTTYFENDYEELVAVNLESAAIASFHLYSNPYQYDGQIYGYWLNPKTNQPLDYMISVIVIAKDSATAQALASILFSMSIPEGQEYMKQYPDAEAMWVYVNENQVIKRLITDSFYSYNERP